jgi:hypothetical protein
MTSRRLAILAALAGGAIALAVWAQAEAERPSTADVLQACDWDHQDRGDGLFEVPFEGQPSVWVEEHKDYVMISALIGKLPERYSSRFLLALLARNHRLYQGRYGLEGDRIWFEAAVPRATLTPELLNIAIGVVAQEAHGFAGARPADRGDR